MKLTEMPQDNLKHIFKFLSFHEIALIRTVCREFNSVASSLLRHEFYRMEHQVKDYRKNLKQALPRRESERRTHALAGHVDVISALETRISLLGMTIMRYVEEGYCAFFPGRVLDELRRVFCVIKTFGGTLQQLQLMKELRDMSSMAMEYFDEQLLPRIQEKMSCRPFPLRMFAEISREYDQRGRLLDGAWSMQRFSGNLENGLSAFPCCSKSVDDIESISQMPESDGLESVTSQVSALRLAVAKLTANQRVLSERNTRLNNLIISLGYRIGRLEKGSSSNGTAAATGVSPRISHKRSREETSVGFGAGNDNFDGSSDIKISRVSADGSECNDDDSI